MTLLGSREEAWPDDGHAAKQMSAGVVKRSGGCGGGSGHVAVLDQHLHPARIIRWKFGGDIYLD